MLIETFSSKITFDHLRHINFIAPFFFIAVLNIRTNERIYKTTKNVHTHKPAEKLGNSFSDFLIFLKNVKIKRWVEINKFCCCYLVKINFYLNEPWQIRCRKRIAWSNDGKCWGCTFGWYHGEWSRRCWKITLK